MLELKGANVAVDGTLQRRTISFTDYQNGATLILTGLADDEEQAWAKQLDSQHDIVVESTLTETGLADGVTTWQGGYHRSYPKMKLASFVVGQDLHKTQDYPVYTATFCRQGTRGKG